MTLKPSRISALIVLLLLGTGSGLSGCGHSQVGTPSLVSSTAYELATSNGHPYMRSRYQWVEVDGARLYGWEDGQSVLFPTGGFEGEYYIVEVTGRFKVPGEGAESVGIALEHTSWTVDSATKFKEFQQQIGWGKRPVSLRRLGDVHSALLPPYPRVRRGYVPDVVGMNSTAAVTLLADDGYSAKLRMQVDPRFPLNAVNGEVPAPGRKSPGGLVTLTYNG
jgi:hypothetical protein